MALELVSSGFGPSTIPDAVIFTCTWELDGVQCHVSVVIDPAKLHNLMFWNNMLHVVGRWYKSKRRVQGECGTCEEAAQRGEGNPPRTGDPK